MAQLPPELLDRIANDPAFREELQNDPAGTLSGYGVELNPETIDGDRNRRAHRSVSARVYVPEDDKKQLSEARGPRDGRAPARIDCERKRTRFASDASDLGRKGNRRGAKIAFAFWDRNYR
ncbi:MAG TPA: hypothetical protein VJ935_12905 [Acidimicrobiia bacterium]|nr:hypothetical protein [Acidimicrobiia bacterium]